MDRCAAGVAAYTGRMPDEPDDLTCPDCGAWAEQSYCDECGADLR